MKILKRPKFDVTKLMELYTERPEDKKASKGADKDLLGEKKAAAKWFSKTLNKFLFILQIFSQ